MFLPVLYRSSNLALASLLAFRLFDGSLKASLFTEALSMVTSTVYLEQQFTFTGTSKPPKTLLTLKTWTKTLQIFVCILYTNIASTAMLHLTVDNTYILIHQNIFQFKRDVFLYGVYSAWFYPAVTAT